MTKKDLKLLEKSIIEKLQNELPKHLYYHSAEHTKRVLEQAEIIANYENVSKRDFKLIRIAALFHDIGFVKSSRNHEEVGCEIAKVFLNLDQLKEGEIEKICGMIMATKVPQTPQSQLDEIIIDADHEYLGTDDFERISSYLYEELKFSNPDLTEKQWTELQINFLQNHRYFTSYGKKYLNKTKQKHLEQLKLKLK